MIALLHAIDEILKDGILEIGVDIDDQFANTKDNGDSNTIGSLEWIDTLEIGDIINAKDDRDVWYEALIRYKKDRKVYIHYIGWTLRFDTIYHCDKYAVDLYALSPRYWHCSRAHRPKKENLNYTPYEDLRRMIRQSSNTLTLSWRMSDTV